MRKEGNQSIVRVAAAGRNSSCMIIPSVAHFHRYCLGLILILGFSFESPLLAGPARLIQAGPMIGHVTDSRARIWVRVKQGADLTAQATQGGSTQSQAFLKDLGSGFHLFQFADLLPGMATKITIYASREGNVESAPVEFQTAPVPGPTGKVRIAFGSCSKVSQYKSAPIYRTIAQEHPDMVILVGDNSYFIVGDGTLMHFHTRGPLGDWSFPEAMLTRHLITRVHPDLRAMLRTVPCYAVWDDHDYGPDNADSLFELRDEASRVFQQIWANPGYGTDTVAGIFSSFRHGPVEVFLMDDRYHKYSPQRHSDVTPETGRIWGKEQTAWLLAGLKASTAPVKLIANGTQFISRLAHGEGHYQEARGEQSRVLRFLNEQRIGGVMFLTGDRHYSEANQHTQPDGTLVVECTSSPLQHGQEVKPLEASHANQIWGMRGNNFGLITVDIPEPGQGQVRFEIRGEMNEVLETKEVKQLKGTQQIKTVTGATTWMLKDLEYATSSGK